MHRREQSCQYSTLVVWCPCRLCHPKPTKNSDHASVCISSFAWINRSSWGAKCPCQSSISRILWSDDPRLFVCHKFQTPPWRKMIGQNSSDTNGDFCHMKKYFFYSKKSNFLSIRSQHWRISFPFLSSSGNALHYPSLILQGQPTTCRLLYLQLWSTGSSFLLENRYKDQRLRHKWKTSWECFLEKVLSNQKQPENDRSFWSQLVSSVHSFLVRAVWRVCFLMGEWIIYRPFAYQTHRLMTQNPILTLIRFYLIHFTGKKTMMSRGFTVLSRHLSLWQSYRPNTQWQTHIKHQTANPPHSNLL